MKKLISFLFLMFFTLNISFALNLDFGFHFGNRQFKGSVIKDTYGGAVIYTPFVKVSLLKWLGISASYETGYKGSGDVGLYNEESVLKIDGINAAITAQYRLKLVEPFIKFGFGRYAYKQKINSEYVRHQVDHAKITAIFGAGINIYLFKSFFITSEFKYVPLKVKPFDQEVDLSGMLFMVGLGYQLDL